MKRSLKDLFETVMGNFAKNGTRTPPPDAAPKTGPDRLPPEPPDNTPTGRPNRTR